MEKGDVKNEKDFIILYGVFRLVCFFDRDLLYAKRSRYACGLGFDVSNGKNVMFFNLGTDTTCSILMTSELRTYTYPGSATYSPYLKLFLIEDEFNASPLSLTLAGSLALSASNNKEPIFVIYKKDHDIEFGGIKLQSINKVK